MSSVWILQALMFGKYDLAAQLAINRFHFMGGHLKPVSDKHLW